MTMSFILIFDWTNKLIYKNITYEYILDVINVFYADNYFDKNMLLIF